MQSSSGLQRVNGIKLFIHRFRDPEAPPSGLTLLLVHGFMDAGGTWDLVAPHLAREGHELVAPDLRGFGQSDAVGAGGYYHFADYVADLSALADALAPRRLGLIGHSMGGTVSALLAGARPDLIERLALLEGVGAIATRPEDAVDRMRTWLKNMREAPRSPKPIPSMQDAVERLSLRHAGLPRALIESRARHLTRLDDQGRLIWAFDPLHRTTAPTPFNAEAFETFLAEIQCPTLVVSGGLTGWHPPDEAKRVARLRDATTFELPDAGHMMHWTEPLPLAARLASFFGAPPPRRAGKPALPEAPLTSASPGRG